MLPKQDGGVAPVLEASDLVTAVPELAEIASIESESLRKLPSINLKFADVASAASRVEAACAEGVDGVVVTVGTDTLEETAFLLDLLLDNRLPVVVTGALRHAAMHSSDGPANLLAAVRVAAHPSAALGVLVVLNDEIHASMFVRKTHTHKLNAFCSPLLGPLGYIVENHVRILLRPVPTLPKLAWYGEPPCVALISIGLGCGNELPIGQSDGEVSGIIVAGAGGGQVPASLVSKLASLAKRIPVVLASRTGAGECLRETYGYPGGGRDLLQRGLIPCGWLDAIKARVLVALLLSNGYDLPRVRSVFDSLGA